MQLVVNGETITVNPGDTVATLIRQLGYRGETFAVALNGDFVPRAHYAQISLSDGDNVDIVAPVVGG